MEEEDGTLQAEKVERRRRSRELEELQCSGGITGPASEADPNADTLGEDILEEEMDRIRRQGTTTSTSSHDEGKEWLKEKHKKDEKQRRKELPKSSKTLPKH